MPCWPYYSVSEMISVINDISSYLGLKLGLLDLEISILEVAVYASNIQVHSDVIFFKLILVVKSDRCPLFFLVAHGKSLLMNFL